MRSLAGRYYLGPKGRQLIATPVRAWTRPVIHDGAPKVRQLISVKASAAMFWTVAPSALDPVPVFRTTPSRAWLLTDGPSGLHAN